jgi:hypothetical protein
MYVFPVLTTPNVSKNILLAVCRSLEHYLIVYHTSEILQRLADMTGEEISLVKHRLVHEDQILQKTKPSKQQSSPSPKQQSSQSPAPHDKDSRDKDKKPEIKVELPQRDAMTLEPTYVTINHPKLGKQIIAIKALPYTVSSEAHFLNLLLDDYSANFIVRIVRILERKIVRTIWKIFSGVLKLNKSVTGDVEKDVIYGTSGHSAFGKDVFVLVDQASLQQEITNNPSKVKKLFGLFWPSFIVVDEIAKTATYCMEGFNGLCSTIHYPYLLASIGSAQKEVYEDLEEVRKASSQFFRLTKNKKTVLECGCLETKDQPLTELTKGGREVLIEDDILPIINRLTDPVKLEKIFSQLKLSISTKNDDLAYKALEAIPSFSIASLEKFGNKGSPNFMSIYDKVQKVLTNSTKIPETLLSSLSAILAIHSSYKVENDKKAVKENLLTFVPIIRQLKIAEFPVRVGVQIFLDTLGKADKAPLAAGLLLLKIYLNSANPSMENKEEDNGGSSI